MYLRTYTARLKPGVLPQMLVLCQGVVRELRQHPGFRYFYLLVDAPTQQTVQLTCWETEAALLAAEPTAARLEGAPWRLHLYATGKATGHFAVRAGDATPLPVPGQVYRLQEIPQRLLPTKLQIAGTLTLAGDGAAITRDGGQGTALAPGNYQIVFRAGGPATDRSDAPADAMLPPASNPL